MEKPQPPRLVPESITAQLMELAQAHFLEMPLGANNSQPESAAKYLDSLRQKTSRQRILDMALAAIVEEARQCTSADGAALALLENNNAFCRACSGELAPSVGTPLLVDSGISAQCLHTGETLRSDDTYCDNRVDQDVCRSLGVRSVVIAPLIDGQQTIGILEVFSRRAEAFHDNDMANLKRLADGAAAATIERIG